MSASPKITSYQRVQTARSGKRKLGSYYISQMLDGFMELHGDRRFGDDAAIIGGVGMLNEMPVTVIAMERGDTIEERMKRKFGCPAPEGYRKALRLMKEAEKFKRPIICMIGSSGAYCGMDAEMRGQGEAIAENLLEMMGLRVPIVSVILGEGGSGGALALGICDCTIMLENSVYSVISPEGCASILWKNAEKAADAADALKLTAEDLYRFEVVEHVIGETERTEREVCDALKQCISMELRRMQKLSPQALLDARYQKFRKIGKSR